MLGPQVNLLIATRKAVEALRGQSPEQLSWLGATGAGAAWRVPVLGSALSADLVAGTVLAPDGRDVHAAWRLIVLHYLAAGSRPAPARPAVTFADLPGGRTYAKVYEQRVTARLCAGVGRDRKALTSAAVALGARRADAGDAAFDLDVFPRVPVRLVWHAGDEEFRPSATLLLPKTIESFFCIEDIVVLSEGVVSRLGGKAF